MKDTTRWVSEYLRCNRVEGATRSVSECLKCMRMNTARRLDIGAHIFPSHNLWPGMIYYGPQSEHALSSLLPLEPETPAEIIHESPNNSSYHTKPAQYVCIPQKLRLAETITITVCGHFEFKNTNAYGKTVHLEWVIIIITSEHCKDDDGCTHAASAKTFTPME